MVGEVELRLLIPGVVSSIKSDNPIMSSDSLGVGGFSIEGGKVDVCVVVCDCGDCLVSNSRILF